MELYGYPILFALFFWWFSTGAIIFLDGLPRRTYPVSMAVASAVAVMALWGIAWSSGERSITGVYCSFSCALLLWAWNEMAFLMGFLTGPRRSPCPPGLTLRERFRFSIQALAHHEAALALTGLLVFLLAAGGNNWNGIATYALLWVMRLSTKVNIFLGVANVAEEMLPPHLHYLKSYFVRARMNPFFPVSLLGSALACWWLIASAMSPAASLADRTGDTLLAALAELGLIEHLFLVIPIPASALWGWGLASHAQTANKTATRCIREAGAP